MMNPATLGIVRHVLTLAAGYFAARYDVDQDSLDAIVSGATAAAGVAWSLYDKRVR
jgi:hypothetical protein